MTFLPVIEMPDDGVEAAIIRPLDLKEIESINQVLKSTFSGIMVRKYIILKKNVPCGIHDSLPL